MEVRERGMLKGWRNGLHLITNKVKGEQWCYERMTFAHAPLTGMRPFVQNGDQVSGDGP